MRPRELCCCCCFICKYWARSILGSFSVILVLVTAHNAERRRRSTMAIQSIARRLFARWALIRFSIRVSIARLLPFCTFIQNYLLQQSPVHMHTSSSSSNNSFTLTLDGRDVTVNTQKPNIPTQSHSHIQPHAQRLTLLHSHTHQHAHTLYTAIWKTFEWNRASEWTGQQTDGRSTDK